MTARWDRLFTGKATKSVTLAALQKEIDLDGIIFGPNNMRKRTVSAGFAPTFT
jgi:hypothetical protein